MPPRILIYLLRRDLRIADNPIIHRLAQLASAPEAPFTHLLPIFVFPAQQIELSGFLTTGASSPYPPARSHIGRFWRCGNHRAKFLAESVWDLKASFEKAGCGLILRVGTVAEVVGDVVEKIGKDADDKDQNGTVSGIWMTSEVTTEEKDEESAVQKVAEAHDIEFKLWTDEKYFVDDRDLPFTDIKDLPDVYTSFRKSLEPLRERPRKALPPPKKLPPLPASIPPQHGPFTIPTTQEDLISALLKPLESDLGLAQPPRYPPATKSAFTSQGGESHALTRLSYLITSGCVTRYKDTRNGLLGEDFSTKLSAWLSFGCLTARQIHHALLAFEDGSDDLGKSADGFGKGENEGTAAVRFELLWRDYMRLCARKFGPKLFHIDGFRSGSGGGGGGGGDGAASNSSKKKNWRRIHADEQADRESARTREVLHRFLAGRTGIGLIDASARELFLTGYTSNRARQNVASFLTSHLGIDWRLGAEWYESLLIDYDTSNNYGNWQYVAGVGNDPRQGRSFNPVKQALDYDPVGAYIKAWVPELRGVDVDGGAEAGERAEEMLMGVFQAWRLPEPVKARLGLAGLDWVEDPLIKIPFAIGRRPREGSFGGRGRGRGRGRSGRGRGSHGGRWRGGGSGGPYLERTES